MLTRSLSTIRRIAVASVIALTACEDNNTATAPGRVPRYPTRFQPNIGFTIAASSAFMVTGSMQKLSAWRAPFYDTRIRVAATWSSNNPSVLTVDATGMATAIGLGEAVVTATVGNEFATREFYVITPSTTGTSNALTVDEFSMIEFQHPGNTAWQYAPQLRVHTEGERFATILSISFSIPGLDGIPSWGCLAPVSFEPSELNGVVYGDWALSIGGNGRATSNEVSATITFVDDMAVIAARTVKGTVVVGVPPTTNSVNNGGLCYRQYLPPN